MSAKSLPCALLSSFTLDQLPALVTRRLQAAGVECRWFVCPFNQYPQQILDEHSELYSTGPRAIFVAVAIEDLLAHLPDAWTASADRAVAASQRIDEFAGLMRRLAAQMPAAPIFVHSFLVTQPQPHALLALKSSISLASLALRANGVLATLAAELSNLFVVNLSDVFQVAAAQPFDSRFFYLAKLRLSREALAAIAQHYQRLLLAYVGQRKKCLVLDLDNTLWGGIVGEDGPERLLLSDDGPGKAFQDFQRVLLELNRSGTVLAVSSRNDAELALSVLRDHPAMLLRPQHFAAMRINWDDKASNLRSIAAELNLGLDSLVFLDDSAFEREQVRRTLPDVTVPEMPVDSSDYPAFAARLPFFDSLTITKEDQGRGQMYVEERQRCELQRQAVTVEVFLRQLALRVRVRRADQFALPRLAQLTQRTNQFNLTTHRYTEDELRAMLADERWLIYSVDACDRIGDSGTVGTALVELRPSLARLDTFLLSCRVLGRGIEISFLAGVMRDLLAVGATTIEAEFIATARNGLAKDFLPNCGFTRAAQCWRRPLADGDALCPAWIQLELVNDKV